MDDDQVGKKAQREGGDVHVLEVPLSEGGDFNAVEQEDVQAGQPSQLLRGDRHELVLGHVQHFNPLQAEKPVLGHLLQRVAGKVQVQEGRDLVEGVPFYHGEVVPLHVQLPQGGHGEQPRPLQLVQLVVPQPEHAEVVEAAEGVQLHGPDAVVGQVQHVQALQAAEAAVLQLAQGVAAQAEVGEEGHVLEDPVVVQVADAVVRQVQQAQAGQRRKTGEVQHAVVGEEQGLGGVGRVGGEVAEPRPRAVDGEERGGGEGGGEAGEGAAARRRAGRHAASPLPDLRLRRVPPVLARPHQGRGPVRGQGQQ